MELDQSAVRPGSAPEPSRAGSEEAPYLEALLEYARRNPGRFHVPGHKGGPAADPGMLEAFGSAALALDIPALMQGIDVGPEPTPFQRAQELAAEAWGAKRTWFLINGASQGNHVTCMSLAQMGSEFVVQRNVHSSTIDGLVISGLRPTFVAPELDPELLIAHCLTPDALDAALRDTPGAVAAQVVSPTYFGAVADVRALAEVAHSHGVPLVVDEAWGAHLAFHPDLPAHALSLGADLVISSTHKIVGSMTQSAMLHLGHGDLLDERVIDRSVTLLESTSPNSLLSGSLDAARRQAALHGEELLGETIEALAATRAAIREIPGLDVLDERMAGQSGVFAYDPLRLCIDVRGTGKTGYEIAPLMLQLDDINLELFAENVMPLPEFMVDLSKKMDGFPDVFSMMGSDGKAPSRFTRTPIEHIYFARAPRGIYTVYANCYSWRERSPCFRPAARTTPARAARSPAPAAAMRPRFSHCA